MLRLDQITLTQDDFSLTADWSVGKGEKIAIIGPSGGGKSTLLLAIAGFLAPSAGRMTWDGDDLPPMPNRPVTILFQDHNLFPHLSAAKNLALGTGASAAQIDDVLTRVGLGGFGGRKPGDLSGGQQGRAALARALLRAKPILLLDEPFSALGPAMKADMLALVGQVAGDAAVLMVTHDPNDALRFADKTVLVADGVAHPPAPTKALFANPPPALRAYLG